MREKKGVRNRCVHPFYFLLFPLHEHCKSLYQHCKSIFTLTQYLSIPYFNSHICIRRRQIISLPVSTHTYYSWLLSASLLLCQVSRATHYSITLNMIRSDSAKRKYLSLFNYKLVFPPRSRYKIVSPIQWYFIFPHIIMQLRATPTEKHWGIVDCQDITMVGCLIPMELHFINRTNRTPWERFCLQTRAGAGAMLPVSIEISISENVSSELWQHCILHKFSRRPIECR